jgi:hypothetical protein
MRRHRVSSGEATVAAGPQNIPGTLHQMQWQGTDTKRGNCFGGLAIALARERAGGNGLSARARIVDGGNFLKKPAAIGGIAQDGSSGRFAFMGTFFEIQALSCCIEHWRKGSASRHSPTVD